MVKHIVLFKVKEGEDAAQNHTNNAKDHGSNTRTIVIAEHQHNTDAGKADSIIKMHIHNHILVPVHTAGESEAN